MNQDENSKIIPIKSDFWWNKENLKNFTSEFTTSRLNNARKQLSNNQLADFKISSTGVIKAKFTPPKKELLNTEIYLKQSEGHKIRELLNNSDELKIQIIDIINHSLSTELYNAFTTHSIELFIDSKLLQGNCNCNNGHEFCEHQLALSLKFIEECKYTPANYFLLHGISTLELKQLFFELPKDDRGKAQLPDFLKIEFYQKRYTKPNITKEKLENYYGYEQITNSGTLSELPDFKESKHYYHKFNQEFYDSIEVIKQEMNNFWQENINQE